MRKHRINLLAAVVIAVGGLALIDQAPAAAQGNATAMACSTPSGGQCTGAKCCTIDDACFDDCPIQIE
ncbi:MAG TPA: hypothetical protein VF158_05400 [Longimicrobiales bacterium]